MNGNMGIYINSKLKFFLFFIGFIYFFIFFILPETGNASRVDELQEKINENNAQIAQIQKEIDELQQELDKTGKDANTFKKQIGQLETTVKKIKADIQLTGRKIVAAGFVIEELNFGIRTKEKKIYDSKKTLAEIIRNMNEAESKSLVEILLAHASLSEFFNDIEQMKDFQNNINANLQQLKELKKDFEKQHEEKETEKKELENLQSRMDDQKTLFEAQKGQKNVLLRETKNKESLYKKQLADQIEKQGALEEEIRALEEEIRIEIDPSSLPVAGSGVLMWPVESRVITQYFGNTPFATQNPQVYGGKGHNGIDIRASVGTLVKASRTGTVVDTGNTDNNCRGVSYGKWVLIKHDNNLSTLYAHLSLIKVSPGQSVETGQIIGYSGNTGFATGPHLHFTVFASSAVEIGSLKSRICGTTMKLPIAPYNAYLNPLSYL